MNHSKRRNTEPKQVIVVRKDLNMPAGKLAAQVSHASFGAVLNSKDCTRNESSIHIDLDNDDMLKHWLEQRFTKVVLYVKSEQKLLDIFNKAKEKGLMCSLIKDAGFTVFSEPTHTCVGIGPAHPEDFIGITDKLRVL